MIISITIFFLFSLHLYVKSRTFCIEFLALSIFFVSMTIFINEIFPIDKLYSSIYHTSSKILTGNRFRSCQIAIFPAFFFSYSFLSRPSEGRRGSWINMNIGYYDCEWHRPFIPSLTGLCVPASGSSGEFRVSGCRVPRGSDLHFDLISLSVSSPEWEYLQNRPFFIVIRGWLYAHEISPSVFAVYKAIIMHVYIIFRAITIIWIHFIRAPERLFFWKRPKQRKWPRNGN